MVGGLARLIPSNAEDWVPEHFFAEVLAVLRRRSVVDRVPSEAQAAAIVGRLWDWHLHRASLAPLLDAGWAYRHNTTAADALYVALAEQLGANLLTDDHRLVGATTFPSRVTAPIAPAAGAGVTRRDLTVGHVGS